MTYVIAGNQKAPTSRLKLKVRRIKHGEDQGSRASWAITARRCLVFWVKLGAVNANGRSDALMKAAARWPDEKHLRADIEVRP